MSKTTDKDKPVSAVTRLFHACLLLLGAVIALWLALELLAQFWGWLLLGFAIVVLIWTVVWAVRWCLDRRW